MLHSTPPAGRGQVIGLLGGSFDPPHAGHVHITREALRRFGLDRVWWLVSPGNPLKAHGPAPLERRLEAARAMMDHPRSGDQRFRGPGRHPLHGRDPAQPLRAPSRPAFRVADGGRQPGAVPSLAGLAGDHADGSRSGCWRGRGYAPRRAARGRRGSSAGRRSRLGRAGFWAAAPRPPGATSTCRWWRCPPAGCGRRAAGARARGNNTNAHCARRPAAIKSRPWRERFPDGS